MKEVSRTGHATWGNRDDAPERLLGGAQYWQRSIYERYHRLGGPAVIHPNGTKSWFKDGVLHRLGGPAVSIANGGTDQWFVDGKATPWWGKNHPSRKNPRKP
jgi:hypothetical protein